MTPPDPGRLPSADDPLDEADFGLLRGIRELFEAADPMPADLPERIRFSLALRDLEIEVARLAEEDQLTVAARGTEQSRTITFDSDSLTIMIRIEANQDGTARVDGWLAPPQCREIEMKTATGSLTVASDEQGRFAFARVPRGTAQLIVAPADHGGRSRALGRYPRAHPLTGSPGRRLPDVPRRTAPCPIASRSLARAESLAREARERGLREGNSGRPAVGARYVRAGLRQLGWTEDGKQPDARQVHQMHHGLAARLLGILAQWESEQGRTEYGLRLLDRAEDLVAADDRGILFLQRGLILMRTGRGGDALKVLDEAVARLERNPAETANLAAALLNRSFVHLNAADVRRARADLVWCQRVADGRRLSPGYGQGTAQPGLLRSAGWRHSRPRCSSSTRPPGLPAERARLPARAGDGQGPRAAGGRPCQRRGQRAGRARWRRSGGSGSITISPKRSWPGRRRRWPPVSRPSRAAGRLAAERRFRRQGNDTWACLAELTRLRARSVSPGRRAPIAAEALRLAGRLRDCGLVNDADLAELLAARALLGGRASGRGEAADRDRAPPRADGAAERQAASPAGSGRAGGAGRTARGGAGRAPGGPGHGAGAARPARQRRPADRDRRLRRGSGRGRPAAGAGAEIRAAGVRLAGTVPGAGVPGQAGASARRPAGRRPSWPSCASSAC